MTLVPPYPGSGWSSAEGPGRKIWGGGSSPPPPGSCTNAILAGTSQDSGRVDVGDHNHADGPLSQVFSLATGAASVYVAVIAAIEFSFSPGPFTTTDAPYTEFVNPVPSLGTAGYRPNATAAGTFAANFTGGDVSNQACVVAAFPCSAGAPVQVAAQLSSGGSAVLPAPPTPGNLLIGAFINLGSAVPASAGWTAIVEDASLPAFDGLHGSGIAVYARCVTEDDTQTILVPDGARVHHGLVSEWAV